MPAHRRIAPGAHRSRRPLVAGIVASVAVAAVLGAVGIGSATAKDTVVSSSVKVIDYKVVKPGTSVSAALRTVPTNASSATFDVWARYAWRTTNISVCAGTTATAACKKNPALVVPVQSAASRRVTVDLSGLKGERSVTVFNSAASVRLTLTLVSYTVPSTTPSTTPTATPKPTATATPKPTATPTATPKPTATPTPTTTPKPTATPTPTATATPKPTATPTPTPTATPKPTATPSPTATATTPVAKENWLPPTVKPLAGRPGPSNTGVPAGTKLKVWEGDLVVDTPGAHIDGLEIHGLVSIHAPNVLITNSKIVGGSTMPAWDRALIQISSDEDSVTVQDTEMYAATPSYRIRGVIGKNFTLTRVNMHDVIDQMVITGDNVTVQDSWLHSNLYYVEDPNYSNNPSHDDNAQISIGKNLKFLRNTMQGTHNASIMITQDRGHVSDVVVADNFIDNGACSINIAEKAYGPIERMTIRNNVFGGNTWVKKCGILSPPTTTAILTAATNTWLDGTPVAISRGA